MLSKSALLVNDFFIFENYLFKSFEMSFVGESNVSKPLKIGS